MSDYFPRAGDLICLNRANAAPEYIGVQMLILHVAEVDEYDRRWVTLQNMESLQTFKPIWWLNENEASAAGCSIMSGWYSDIVTLVSRPT